MTSQDFRKTPPPIAAMTAMTLPPMQQAVTPGGIRLHILHCPDLPVLFISAIFDGGVAEIMSPAAATLAAAAAREGTAEFRSAEIASRLELAGATLKISASGHNRRFDLFALDKGMADVIPIFADVVCRPTFPERETSVRAESFAGRIEIARENVGFIANVESDRLIMGAHHPLAIEDSPSDIRLITPARLRSFTESFASPDRLNLFLCGNISDSVISLIAREFDSRLALRTNPSLNILPFTPSPAGTRSIIHKADASQTAIYLTLPAIPRSHPDYLPLHLTTYALGGYFGSRLMSSIREEKGLTYGIQASLLGYREGAFISISAEADNSYVDRVIDEVRAEMTRMASDPPSGYELRRVCQSSLSTHAAALDSPITITSAHIDAQTLDLPPGYFNAKQQAIHALTSDRIADISARYLNPDSLLIALVGR